ncbi:MAG: ABC transporter permease [Treponema sp.]|nr:ABC transporter permease [Treponema sp.]
MTFSSSLKFAKSLIFPKTEKKSSARRSLFGALICIGISIVPLIVVMAISNGMIEGMTERIIGLSSSHIQAYVSPAIIETETAELYQHYAESYRKYDGILNTYAEMDINALAASSDYRTGAQIRAMDADIFDRNSYFCSLFYETEGSIKDYTAAAMKNEKVCSIGQKLAEILNLHPGDSIRIITTRRAGDRLVPKLTSFKVCAVISSGYQELDALWVFVPLSVAYDTLSRTNAGYTIMLQTKDAYSPDLVRIQAKLQMENSTEANFYRWDQVHQNEFQNFSSTKVMLIFVMILIVLVASINVSSAIVMLVMERRKEIAILKSIGATPSGITISFLLTGMACGIGGVLIGLPVGLLLSVNSNQLIAVVEKIVNFFARYFYLLKGTAIDDISIIRLMDPSYYLQNIPVTISFGQVFLVASLTVMLSLIVSIIPSAKAGKEKPLEILRKS